MEKPKNYHSCLVRNCPNSKRERPDMDFFIVPKELPKRKLWVKAASQRLNYIGIRSVKYVCEDHFDVDDVSVFGLNPDAVPHKRLNLHGIKTLPLPLPIKKKQRIEKNSQGIRILPLPLPIKKKQVKQKIENIKQQNIFNNKVSNIPGPVSNKCVPTIKIEVANGKIIYTRDDPIKNKPETVNPIRIQQELSKLNPQIIITQKQVQQKNATNLERQNIDSKIENIPKKPAISVPISNKFIQPANQIERPEIIKEVAKEKIIYIRDEPIKNKPETVNPIRIQQEISKPNPPIITPKLVEQKIAKNPKRQNIDSKIENTPKKLAISVPISNKVILPTNQIERPEIIKEVAKGKIINITDEQIKNKPQNKNEIEFRAVPVNRTEFCKETIPVRPRKPELQTCESCGNQFCHLNLHIKNSACKNYWLRLENKNKIPGPVKIEPKPGPVQNKINYDVSFVPEQRQITITYFDPDEMK